MKTIACKIDPRLEKRAAKMVLSICVLALALVGCMSPINTSPVESSSPRTLSPDTAQPGTFSSSLDEIQTRGVLIVGTAITEPFEFYDPDTNELVGFDVDVARYIADSLGVELSLVEMPFANLLPALQERKVDMTIAAMYITPERQELVDFTDAYLDTGLVMVVRPEAEIKTIQDLDGLKVGVKIGATGAKLAQELIEQGILLESHEYKDTFESLLDLQVGRLDAVFNDYLNTLVFIKKSQSDIKIVTDPAGEINFLSRTGMGIAVHKGDRALLNAINNALFEMKKDGSFARYYRSWLSETQSIP